MRKITRKEAQDAYDAGCPIMTDQEFDEKFSEQGGKLGQKGTVEHQIPMLSQQKAHHVCDVEMWMRDIMSKGAEKFCASLKMDGIACSLVYQDGILVQASTRGDGLSGEDVTEAVKAYVCNIPAKIYTKKRIEIRGEIVAKKMQNSRNVACGIIMRKEITPSDIELHFIAWDIIANGKAVNLSYVDDLKRCKFIGFETVPFCEMVDDLDEIMEHMADIRSSSEYPSDGVVIRCDDRMLDDMIGCTKHHPRYSIAYKWNCDEYRTRIISIDVRDGKAGKKTPVASVEPVCIDGAWISSVSLGSVDRMNELGCREGSLVMVKRSGGVIPVVTRVLS